jgi:hypothetical protein
MKNHLRLQFILSKNAADDKTKKQNHTTSVAQSNTIHQLFLMCRECRLTDAIQLLESLGYYGETALFVLAYIQYWEVA